MAADGSRAGLWGFFSAPHPALLSGGGHHVQLRGRSEIRAQGKATGIVTNKGQRLRSTCYISTQPWARLHRDCPTESSMQSSIPVLQRGKPRLTG